MAEALRRIGPLAHRTPVIRCAAIDARAGAQLFLKAENLQRGGAFKIRGAANAIARLDEATARRGVVTHSSGNHAQAVAIAARARGIPATIVMPRGAPEVKRAAVAGYGGRVVECDPTLAARESAAAHEVAVSGGTLIPPYDHPDVIAGQGTVALELLEQIPELDAVVAPVGGGGLVSGIALALRELRPGLPVYAAEPLGADDAARSRAAGRRLPQQAPDTVADGLRTSLGDHTWPVVRDLIADVVVVDDEEILASMFFLLERAKLLVEPSGAVALAAASSPAFRARGHRRVAVVLSGGNVNLADLADLARRRR